ncbi:MAG: Na/Pi cotransporter family protein [Clostridia bacterium]|nr:Na/Pi cotransporter family protein [Clostridia bacterium]
MEMFKMVIGLCAGLVFFLFGMSTMSAGLEKAAGSKLEVILKKMTDKPVIGVFMGLIITAVIQSSSATTVILVGLVNSGLMSFRSTIAVLFGANIGTTVTSWLLSLAGLESSSFIVQIFKPQIFSPLFAVVGTAFMMMAKSDKKKNLGAIFVGFTVLIYGMDIMSGAVESLADKPWFGDLLLKFNNPVLGVIIGAVLTAIIQSSSASVGILQALSLTGAITYNMAVPIIVGQNIGTCVTGLISSIGAGAKAKRVALSQLLINLFGAIILLPIYLVVTGLVDLGTEILKVNPVSIAIIHSVFNIVTVIILMPFIKLIAKLCEKLVREKKGKKEKDEKRAVYLDERLLNTPSIAVMECDNYTVKMSILAKETVLESLKLLKDYNKDSVAVIHDNEKVLDLYEDNLGTYLVKMSEQSLSNNDARTVARMLHTIGDFERLGDHAKGLQKVAEEIHDKQIKFSDSAVKEIDVLTDAITEIIITTTLVYEKNDYELATRVEPLEQVIDRITAEIKAHHIKRLQKGDCTIEMGFVLSDLLTNCKRISDHCSNIAVAIIEARNDSFDTHHYLNSVKYGNDSFTEVFEEYNKKYDLHA